MRSIKFIFEQSGKKKKSSWTPNFKKNKQQPFLFENTYTTSLLPFRLPFFIFERFSTDGRRKWHQFHQVVPSSPPMITIEGALDLPPAAVPVEVRSTWVKSFLTTQDFPDKILAIGGLHFSLQNRTSLACRVDLSIKKMERTQWPTVRWPALPRKWFWRDKSVKAAKLPSPSRQLFHQLYSSIPASAPSPFSYTLILPSAT